MKKKILIPAFAAFLALGFTACDTLSEIGSSVLGDGTGTTSAPGLSNDEVISGLKEALTVGAKNASSLTSKVDGFDKNAKIRLPFPPDAMKVKEKALALGLDGQVEKFELTLNRAAEEAAKEAAPIFVSAVKDMSVADGFAILKGNNDAATVYLKDKTSASLKTAFTPKVEAAIATVKLTDYWEPLASKYNTAMKFTGGEQINPDLTDYVTNMAMTGLFTMIAEEEGKIRDNPAARVTDLLQKVFGSLTGK